MKIKLPDGELRLREKTFPADYRGRKVIFRIVVPIASRAGRLVSYNSTPFSIEFFPMRNTWRLLEAVEVQGYGTRGTPRTMRTNRTRMEFPGWSKDEILANALTTIRLGN